MKRGVTWLDSPVSGGASYWGSVLFGKLLEKDGAIGGVSEYCIGDAT